MAKVFRIELEKGVYFPGETVRGRVVLETTAPIQCRAIRVWLQGKGHAHIIRRCFNAEHYYHTHFYANCRKTVFGHLLKTPIVDEAGSDVIYGPPWAPDEGVVEIPMSSHQNRIIVRVMDYDWCKKDDLLGETVIDIHNNLNRGFVTQTLSRNGKEEAGSTVTFALSDVAHSTPSARIVRLQILSANGFRSGDW